MTTSGNFKTIQWLPPRACSLELASPSSKSMSGWPPPVFRNKRYPECFRHISPGRKTKNCHELSTWPKILSIWVCLKIVYPYTQWLMIIIPTKWLFHWGYTPFSDKPIYAASGDPHCHHQHPSTSGMGVAPWIKNCWSENQVLQNLIVDHHFPHEIAINWDIPHFLTKRHASSCKMST